MMGSAALRPTAFRGDTDVDDLHQFFRPEHQFDGDTRWTVGTSLKSAYLDCFEFFNEPPVVQLWRDEGAAVQAVSRVSLGAGKWFFQASPTYRGHDHAAAIIEQSDSAFRLLSEHDLWWTACHESDLAGIKLLEQSGYVTDRVDEVYMVRSLALPIEAVACPAGIDIGLLDVSDAVMLGERGLAQIDAFSDGAPTDDARAWIARGLPLQISYGRPHVEPMVVATDRDGRINAFADVFFDRANLIGEFEPVGTRRAAQRQGLAKAVMSRGLQEMVAAGMHTAVVRTGHDNAAAIAAYESMGFVVQDRLLGFRKNR
jgi:GNAT superfamily N-acetyltransferase